MMLRASRGRSEFQGGPGGFRGLLKPPGAHGLLSGRASGLRRNGAWLRERRRIIPRGKWPKAPPGRTCGHSLLEAAVGGARYVQ